MTTDLIKTDEAIDQARSEKQTALLLSDQELDDLATITRPYVNTIAWARKAPTDDPIHAVALRRFALIKRINEAAS